MAERVVTLVLVTRAGDVVGVLDAFTAPVPWWSEVRSVVAGAGTAAGVGVTVLRLLEVESDHEMAGGRVTYLAELDGPAPAGLRSWDGGELSEDPRRARWARAGGPAADLAWAEEALAGLGREPAGAALQHRTWNLSSLWVIPTRTGDVWLKAVPPFLSHEGRVLSALQGGPVPTLLAADDEGRVLLEHVPGENQFGAGPELLLAMVDMLVDIQSGWIGRQSELLGLGMPDWRRTTFAEAAADTVARAGASVASPVRSTLHRLLAGLDDRFAALADCGVPETLMHGDFHPGNFRYDGQRLVLLDWGDCGVGHPLLDMSAFLERVSPEHGVAIKNAWADRWMAAVPGCDPRRAARLLAPIGALRRAIVFRRFLDAIETSEHCYHERDVPDWLQRAASAEGMT